MSLPSNTLFLDFKEIKTILVSGLPLTVKETSLFDYVNKEFPNQVINVQINKDFIIFDFVIAQIEMASHDAAAQTIAKLNGTLFQEKKINMSWKQGDYKQRTLTETKLIVKGIKREVDQNKLQQVFDKYGNTLSVKLGTNEKNESNGYGIVEYCSIEEVNKVIESKEVLKKEIGEDNFDVVKFGKQSRNTRTNVYIENIDADVTEEQFVEYFETFGPIKTDPNGTKLYKYVFDETHQKYKGFVNYQNIEDAEKAISSPKSGVLGSGDIIIAFYKSEEERKRERKIQSLQIKDNIVGKYKDFNLQVNTKQTEISEEELRQKFVDCGEIYFLQVKYIDGKPTGIAYVCFTNQESTTKAIQIINEAGWECEKFLNRTEKMSKTMYAPQMPFNFPMNYQMDFNQVYMQFMQQFTSLIQMPRQQQETGDGNVEQKPRERRDINYHDNEPRQQRQQQPHVVEKAPGITEEMKNELGDDLYDFISNLGKYDEDLTGRITGVLLETIDYHEIKNSLNSKPKELENIVAKIVEDLKKTDA